MTKPPGQLRVLARNLCSNWVGFAVHAAVAFFLTPFILRHLGDAGYGVWALLASLTGYYGLLDAGLRVALTRSLTRDLAVGDYGRLNRTASTGMVALAVVAVFVLLASLLLGWATPWFINDLQPGVASEIWWCFLLVGAALAVQFVLFPFSAVFTATQRFDLANALGITTRLLSAGAVVLLLNAGYGLIGLSAVVAGSNVLDYGLRWLLAYRILPQLHVSPRLADKDSLREIAHFGVWNTVDAASVRIILYTDGMVIGWFLSPAAIALFALAANVRNYFDELFAPVGHVFFPPATHAHARGDAEGLRRLYLGGTRLLAVLATGAGLIAAFWAEDFFRLWLGERYADGAGSVPMLFQILLGAAVATASQRLGTQVLLAAARVKTMVALTASEAAANLVLSILLVRQFGLLGVALGTLLPALVVQFFVKPWCVLAFLRISTAEYLREVWGRTALVGVVAGGLLFAVRWLGPAESWPALLGQGGLATAIVLGATAALGLTKAERGRFLRALLRRASVLWQRRGEAARERDELRQRPTTTPPHSPAAEAHA
jgi:O-antigen/teichoic acid export membrane protein